MQNQSILESTQTGQHSATRISRLDFLKRITFSFGILATSCTPVKILLNTHDDKYDEDKNLKSKILAAFVTTVIPGADPDDEENYKIFCDDYYPFHKYCVFFVSDLCIKSKKLFGTESFYDLSLEQRTEVIQAGLEDDFTTARLYTAAIFISQVSVYCSIYNDEKGCSLIDYSGAYGFMNAEMYYAEPSGYLAIEMTSTGNYS